MNRLEIKLMKKNKNNLTFEVPSHRFDLSIKEDLIEEVARIIRIMTIYLKLKTIQ